MRSFFRPYYMGTRIAFRNTVQPIMDYLTPCMQCQQNQRQNLCDSATLGCGHHHGSVLPGNHTAIPLYTMISEGNFRFSYFAGCSLSLGQDAARGVGLYKRQHFLERHGATDGKALQHGAAHIRQALHLLGVLHPFGNHFHV